jgi:hypothetical protein
MEVSGTDTPITNGQMDKPNLSTYTQMKKKIPLLLGTEPQLSTVDSQRFDCAMCCKQHLWQTKRIGLIIDSITYLY